MVFVCLCAGVCRGGRGRDGAHEPWGGTGLLERHHQRARGGDSARRLGARAAPGRQVTPPPSRPQMHRQYWH